MQKFLNFFQNKIQSSGQRVDKIYVSQRLCLISMISTEEEGEGRIREGYDNNPEIILSPNQGANVA